MGMRRRGVMAGKAGVQTAFAKTSGAGDVAGADRMGQVGAHEIQRGMRRVGLTRRYYDIEATLFDITRPATA